MNEHHVPDQPTAEACFAEAAANLRAAEQLATGQNAADGRVDQIVYIADAWTRLGAAVDNRQGWEGATPIPIRLIGDEDPQWTPPRSAQAHIWPSIGATVCTRCGFGPSEVGAICYGTAHEHQWSPFSSVCQVSGCGLTREQRTAEDRPKTAPHTETSGHTAECRHSWVRPMEKCRNGCGTGPFETPGDADRAGICAATCPALAPVHGDCGAPLKDHGPHEWSGAATSCSNGCGEMPEGFYIGKSPSSLCMSACPGWGE